MVPPSQIEPSEEAKTQDLAQETPKNTETESAPTVISEDHTEYGAKFPPAASYEWKSDITLEHGSVLSVEEQRCIYIAMRKLMQKDGQAAADAVESCLLDMNWLIAKGYDRSNITEIIDVLEFLEQHSDFIRLYWDPSFEPADPARLQIFQTDEKTKQEILLNDQDVVPVVAQKHLYHALRKYLLPGKDASWAKIRDRIQQKDSLFAFWTKEKIAETIQQMGCFYLSQHTEEDRARIMLFWDPEFESPITEAQKEWLDRQKDQLAFAAARSGDTVQGPAQEEPFPNHETKTPAVSVEPRADNVKAAEIISVATAKDPELAERSLDAKQKAPSPADRGDSSKETASIAVSSVRQNTPAEPSSMPLPSASCSYETAPSGETTGKKEEDRKKTGRSSHSPVSGEMIYAKYRGTSRTSHNLLFETPDGDYLYVNSKYATQDVHAMKKNAWFWVERGKKIDQDAAGGFGRYVGKMLSAGGNIGRDVWRFCQTHTAGDIITCPISKKTLAGLFVSLGPNYYAILNRDDIPLGLNFSSIEAGNLYKFEITEIRKEKKRTKVSLRIIEKFNDSYQTKLWRRIPDTITNRFAFNYERLFEYILRDETLFAALKQKLGGIITPPLLRNYIGAQYYQQKQDGTLVVHQNARGLSIDVDLDIKNKYGAPIKAGINQKADRVNDLYLALIGAVDPGSEMERFVYIEDWDDLTKTLAEMALPEEWDYGENSGRPRRHILAQYLRFNFYKARLDHDLYEEHGEALFNTGLVDTSYDDIFCYLKKNNSINDTLHRKWTIGYFACRGKGTNGKALNALFQDFPAPPQYIKTNQLGNLFFDTSKELACDYDHIIMDNMKRLPMTFISHRLAYDQALRTMIEQEKARVEIEDYICDSPGLVKTLEDGLKSAVDIAVKFCKWNYKTAIPIYYAKTNAISLLLPLKLTENAGNADIALVVEKLPNGNYQGQTILTMEMAYLDARQICRPNSDWLTLQNVRNAESSDEEAGEGDDIEEEG